VVWIHGCRQDPEAFAAGTRIARFADERGFVVLLPRQSRMANSERCWNWFDRRTAAGAGERRSSPPRRPR
jgi:poly(3-hydroxybutyrate) depolymerase